MTWKGKNCKLVCDDIGFERCQEKGREWRYYCVVVDDERKTTLGKAAGASKSTVTMLIQATVL
jgi:hypothetical protein